MLEMHDRMAQVVQLVWEVQAWVQEVLDGPGAYGETAPAALPAMVGYMVVVIGAQPAIGALGPVVVPVSSGVPPGRCRSTPLWLGSTLRLQRSAGGPL